MYGTELRDEAVRLRTKERKSLPEIQNILHVARSSLSLWLREFPLSKEETLARKQVTARKARESRTAHMGREENPGEWSSRPNLSKVTLGEACRQAICTKLLFEGFKIFLPLTEDTPVDLVALTPKGDFLKCQCKCVFRSKGRHNHLISLVSVRKASLSSKTKVHKYTKEEVDFFLGYCPDNGVVYVISHEDARGRAQINLWVTAKSAMNNDETAKWENAFHLMDENHLTPQIE